MTTLARKNPREAYARVNFEARVVGADPRQLVGLCYEELIASLGSAVFAVERDDNLGKSRAMTRALSALTALAMGVTGEEGVALSLRQFYEAARKTLLDNVLAFDARAMKKLRQDFIDIAGAVARG